MKTIVRTIALVLALCAAAALASCGEKREAKKIIEELAVYYGTYGGESDEKVGELLSELKNVDEIQGAKWEKIMTTWRALDGGCEVNYDVLPDGLPDTDELCLVALGFQLNPDGTMKDELISRLGVVLASAKKYPDSLIVCTGGGTASENKDATESGRMAEWLIENGVARERVIVEDKSLTTAQNAIYTYKILSEKYPQVKKIAIISSDYHIATGVLLFGAEATITADKAGDDKYEIISNAGWKAPSGTLSRMFQAGALIELSGDVETAFDIYYEEYDIHELPPLDK